MKTLAHVMSLLAASLLAVSAQAQVPGRSEPLQSLRVQQSELPVFPYELVKLGVREGEARIAFSVDTNGKIEDVLAVAYSHPEFARVSIAALRHWRFEPAIYRGRPIAAATEISVKFEVQGTVVVSLTPSDTISVRIYQILESHDSYRPYTLKELDRIPVPIAAPSPAMPASFLKGGALGQVTVSFYIDENGVVRMPSVNADDDPELGAAAIDALRNWKFEPPTCKGHPVLVKATQPFNFRAPIAKNGV